MRMLMSLLALGFMAETAWACSMPTPLFSPRSVPADVIVEAIALTPPVETYPSKVHIEVHVQRVWLGTESPATVMLAWNTNVGACSPPGIIPNEGMRLMISLARDSHGYRPVGWRQIESAPDAELIRLENNLALAETERMRASRELRRYIDTANGR